MTGDRRLTQEEKVAFITHVFKGLEKALNSLLRRKVQVIQVGE